MKYSYLVLFSLLLITGCARLFLDVEEYKIHKTENFIFYYKEGSRVAADIEQIATLSQNGVKWLENDQGYPVNLKVEAYLFDNGRETSYYKTVKGLEKDSTSELKGAFQVCYDSQNYDKELLSRVIIHEFIHVVQQHRLHLFNITLSEGHAYYYELKYYITLKVGSCSDRKLLSYFREAVTRGLQEGDSPTRLLPMNFQQFQNFDFISLKRDPGQRYKIAASFIAYLSMKYGMERVNRWLELTGDGNYKEAFHRVYPVSLEEAEEGWISHNNIHLKKYYKSSP